MVIGGSSSKTKHTNNNKRSRQLNDNNTLLSSDPSKNRRRVHIIYCHQCHQRDLGFTVTCKNQNGNKPCALNFCDNCLLRSYGDKAREIALLDDWACPRCRDICLCPICRKKLGMKTPVSHVVRSAKPAGFAFGSEMTTRVKNKKPIALNKEIRSSPRTQRKKGSLDEVDIANTKPLNVTMVANDNDDGAKIAKKPKIEDLKEEICNDNDDKDNGLCVERPIVIDQMSHKETKTDEIEHHTKQASEKKKRGKKNPVAHVVHSTKLNEFGFGSEMTTQVKRKKPIALNKEIRVSPRTQRKKGSLDEIDNANTKALNTTTVSDDDGNGEKIAKKPKMEGLEEVISKNNKDDGLCVEMPIVSEQMSDKEAKTDETEHHTKQASKEKKRGNKNLVAHVVHSAKLDGFDSGSEMTTRVKKKKPIALNNEIRVSPRTQKIAEKLKIESLEEVISNNNNKDDGLCVEMPIVSERISEKETKTDEIEHHTKQALKKNKRGNKNPVAHVVHSEKLDGFDFGSEMTTRVKRKKPIALNKEIRVSPRTQRKKSSSDEIDNADTKPLNPTIVSDDDDQKIDKKPNIGLAEVMSNDNKEDDLCVERHIVIEQMPEKETKTDEIEHASNEVLMCPIITPEENEIEDKDVEENQDVGDVIDYAWEGDNADVNNTESHFEGTETDVEIETPQPQGNIFRRSVSKFFGWFAGSS